RGAAARLRLAAGLHADGVGGGATAAARRGAGGLETDVGPAGFCRASGSQSALFRRADGVRAAHGLRRRLRQGNGDGLPLVALGAAESLSALSGFAVP